MPPTRNPVYTAGGLFSGYQPAVTGSYAETMDFHSYQWFVKTGRSTPIDPYAAMMRALHDSSVTFDVGGVISGRRVVGIMGGHQLPRDSAAYRRIAELRRAVPPRSLPGAPGRGPGPRGARPPGPGPPAPPNPSSRPRPDPYRARC